MTNQYKCRQAIIDMQNVTSFEAIIPFLSESVGAALSRVDLYTLGINNEVVVLVLLNPKTCA